MRVRAEWIGKRTAEQRGLADVKLRMLTSVVKFAVATAVMTGVVFSASAQAPAAPAAGSGGYKIGVVDRKQVFDDYGKKKSQWDQLSTEKTKIENELNASFDNLKKEKDTFDSNKASLSEEQRSAQETALSKKLADLRFSAQARQKELDEKGERIIKELRQEIDAAVKAIGAAGNYHLILEADTAFSSVIYFEESMNITPQVIQYVNEHSGSAAAAAPAAEKKPDTKNKR
ncbi:MAG: OmpH family outer membrane protein [FCB group bacterium]|jgi:Skp family chaperone for outer membrane proteins|nr:OmpH family outer membrane protein [FCB group bacterium]